MMLIILLGLNLYLINGCGMPCSENNDDNTPCVADYGSMFDLCDCQSTCTITTCSKCDIRDDNESKYDHCLRICKDEYYSTCNSQSCEQYCSEPTTFDQDNDGFACIIPCNGNKEVSELLESVDNSNDVSPQQILSKTTQKFEGFIKDTWQNLKPFLHPTQPDIGYAWAIRKVKSSFDSAESAQNSMNHEWSDKWPNINATDLKEISETIPCIIGRIGPNTKELTFYVIDSHHTLSALDYSGYSQTTVYLNVMFDYRMYEYKKFVSKMIKTSNTYLYSQHGTKKLPILINFSNLPKTFDFNRNKKTFGDNPWRSLAGYSRKVNVAPNSFPECINNEGDSKYCMRPWIRICDDNGNGIPFYEFMWAYFYVDACYINTKYWDGTLGYNPMNTFINLYQQLLNTYYDCNGNWIDIEMENYEELVNEWLAVARKLVPLARGEITKQYELINYFNPDTLPGYVEGTTKINDDPSCQL